VCTRSKGEIVFKVWCTNDEKEKIKGRGRKGNKGSKGKKV
jgi:hypothetical protein